MFNFDFTLQETNVILSALAKGQYDQVAPLINKIQQQAQPQLPRVQAEEQARTANEQQQAEKLAE